MFVIVSSILGSSPMLYLAIKHLLVWSSLLQPEKNKLIMAPIHIKTEKNLFLYKGLLQNGSRKSSYSPIRPNPKYIYPIQAFFGHTITIV